MPDLLIEHGWLMLPAGWSQPGYLAISDGKISALGVGETPESLRAAVRSGGEVIQANGMAVMPGLTNAHTHLSQTFMRGLSGGRALLSWLKELIWPLQDVMSLEEMELAAWLGMVENLRCGVTQVVEHQKITRSIEYTQAVCRAAERTGMRLTLARAWADRGAQSESLPAILQELTTLFEQYAGHRWIRIASGPLTPWRVTPDGLQKTHTLAQRWNSFSHIHAAETNAEVDVTFQETGHRPVAWLDQVGILGADCQVVHATWLAEEEIELLAERKALVVHCPVSNAVLGSGIAPIHDLAQKGVRIHLGTDGPASNDNQDCFDCMKAALMMAHVRANDPTHLAPADIVRMATAGKTLRIGEDADVILVNLLHANAVPVQDIDAALVLSCHGSDVDTVVVGGNVLMRARRILMVDEAGLLQECQRAVEGLRRRAGFETGAPHLLSSPIHPPSQNQP